MSRKNDNWPWDKPNIVEGPVDTSLSGVQKAALKAKNTVGRTYNNIKAGGEVKWIAFIIMAALLFVLFAVIGFSCSSRGGCALFADAAFGSYADYDQYTDGYQITDVIYEFNSKNMINVGGVTKGSYSRAEDGALTVYLGEIAHSAVFDERSGIMTLYDNKNGEAVMKLIRVSNKLGLVTGELTAAFGN